MKCCGSRYAEERTRRKHFVKSTNANYDVASLIELFLGDRNAYMRNGFIDFCLRNVW